LRCRRGLAASGVGSGKEAPPRRPLPGHPDQFPTIALCEAKLLDVLFPHLATVHIAGLSHEKGVARLQALLDRCPELNALAGHVRAFAEMIRELRGDHLQEWMDEVQAENLPALHSFVIGLPPRS
jgi:hypothetical protein